MNPGMIGLLLAAGGLLLLWLALRQLRRRRLLRCGASGLLALGLLATGALLFGLAASFRVYERLSSEQPVGTIGFVALSPQSYEARLELSGVDRPLYFRLDGDEWQLDARFVKWTGPGQLLGFDSFYQLDRLTGRYREIAAQRTRGATAYGLAPMGGEALWHAASVAGRWAPLIDAVYGSATYLPMADGASYAIAVTPSGLLARPANPAAVAAVGDW